MTSEATAPRSRAIFFGAALAVSISAGGSRVLANTPVAALSVRVADAAWPAAIAALQSDTRSEGRTLDVSVFDAENQLSCGEYTLTLDDVSSAAFEMQPCDPHHGTTRLRLAHRDALFGAGRTVPRALAAGVSIVEIRHGGAAGGAGTLASSDVTCSTAVRPYLQDLQHGRRVYLTPREFDLRVVSASASSHPEGSGWTLSGRDGELSIEYEVRDRVTGEVVIHDRAAVRCSNAPARETERPIDTGRVTESLRMGESTTIRPARTDIDPARSIDSETAPPMSVERPSYHRSDRDTARTLAAAVVGVALVAVISIPIGLCATGGGCGDLSGLSGLSGLSF